MPTSNVEIKERMFQESWAMLPKFILRMEELEPTAKLIFMFLLDRVRTGGGGRCMPGLDTMAHNTGTSKRTAQNAVRKLEKLGFLETERRGLTRTNLYALKEVPEWVLSKYGDLAWEELQKKACDGVPERPESQEVHFLNGNGCHSRSADFAPKEDKGERDKEEEDDDCRAAPGAGLPSPDASSIAEEISKEAKGESSANACTPSKGKNRAVQQGLDYFRKIFFSHMRACTLPSFGKREYKHVKDLIAQWGEEPFLEVVEFFIRNWARLKRKFSVKSGVPTIRVLYGFRDSIFAEFKQPTGTTTDRCVPDDSPEVGWE